MRVLMICPELPRADKPGSMAPGARQIRSIQEAGVETEILDMRGIPKLKYLQALPKIRHWAKRVDLIHAHYGYCGWLALLGRKLSMRRVPIVMSFMGDDLLGTTHNHQGDQEWFSKLQAKWNARISKHYDQVIVKSQQMAELISPTPCHIVSNGVDVEVFYPGDPLESCQQVGLDPTRFKVLFPGNPENVGKGYVLAGEAVKVAERLIDAQIQLVPLWGVAPDHVSHYMNACQVMLMASFTEGSPNVIKEGLACNMSIVSVPVGDVREMLQGVEGCCCISSRDPEELGTALAQQLLAGEGSQGRSAIMSRELSLESVAKRIIRIYDMALSGRSAHTALPISTAPETRCHQL